MVILDVKLELHESISRDLTLSACTCRLVSWMLAIDYLLKPGKVFLGPNI